MQKYDENWVMARRNRNHGFDPIKHALSMVNNPQNDLRIIHVTGTNGKGSTCNYLKDLLVSQGYKVGMFTSPFLEKHFDRIRINDVWISKQKFDDYLNDNIQTILEDDLSMFEIDFLIALLWYQEEHCDFVIIECGLGARHDYTNIISHPVLSIITTIHYDHMNQMGNRIQQIAYEKAGIFKKGCTTICGTINHNCHMILKYAANRIQAKYITVPKYYNLSFSTFRFDGDTYKIGMYGQYQKYNASMVLYAAKLLGIDIHTEDIKNAIYHSMWKGRFEVIHHNPVIIVDGAHNEEGIIALANTIQRSGKKTIVVFSALADKPGRKMASILNRCCDQLVITHFENRRSGNVEEFMVPGARLIPDYEEAIQYALTHVKDEWIIVCGSLYFVSVIRDYMARNAEKAYDIAGSIRKETV